MAPAVFCRVTILTRQTISAAGTRTRTVMTMARATGCITVDQGDDDDDDDDYDGNDEQFERLLMTTTRDCSSQ